MILSLILITNACLTLQVVLLIVMFIMRKRVALTISLFHVAGKVFIHLPLLALQPFWTFLCLMLFWVYWITVLLFLGTSGPETKAFCSKYVGVDHSKKCGTLGDLLNTIVHLQMINKVYMTKY